MTVMKKTRFKPPMNKATVGKLPMVYLQNIDPQRTVNKAYMKRQPK